MVISLLRMGPGKVLKDHAERLCLPENSCAFVPFLTPVTKHLTRVSVRKEEFILTHSLRGVEFIVVETTWWELPAPKLRKQAVDGK